MRRIVRESLGLLLLSGLLLVGVTQRSSGDEPIPPDPILEEIIQLRRAIGDTSPPGKKRPKTTTDDETFVRALRRVAAQDRNESGAQPAPAAPAPATPPVPAPQPAASQPPVIPPAEPVLPTIPPTTSNPAAPQPPAPQPPLPPPLPELTPPAPIVSPAAPAPATLPPAPLPPVAETPSVPPSVEPSPPAAGAASNPQPQEDYVIYDPAAEQRGELVDSLRATSRLLDAVAHDHEDNSQYDEADRLHNLARKLRTEARRLDRSADGHPTYGPPAGSSPPGAPPAAPPARTSRPRVQYPPVPPASSSL